MKARNTWMYFGAVLMMSICISCSGQKDTTQKTATQNVKSPALSPEAQKLLSLLPESNAVPGWTRGADVRFFNPDNLFEYIDGAAENYLIYGFQQVVTAEYTNPQKPSQAVVEIYQMKDPRNAFGIYASERNPDSEFRQIGAEGYIGGTALNFWSGPYYIKITVFQEDAALKQEMVKIAENLSQKIGVPGAIPPEIDGFPRAGLVPHSVRFLAQDVLGQAYLKEGFEAKYGKKGSETKIVIAVTENEAAAKEALAKYREYTAKSGSVQRELSAPGDGGFLGKDGYYGNMAAIRNGSRLIIALGGASTNYALSQAAACVKK
jgi:hypothetical protein